MIYNETISKVENGALWRIDLKRKSLWVNGKFVIKEGVHDGELIEKKSQDEVLYEADRLFHVYYRSIPSERSNIHKKYFATMNDRDLCEDILWGEQRETAQLKLELFILCHILDGNLKWQSYWPNVFFRVSWSFILLKEYF